MADAYLVDTSVFLRWFIDQEGFEHARAMLRMYDALFVQLAIELRLPLLTADAKLCAAVRGTVETELLRGVGPK